MATVQVMESAAGLWTVLGLDGDATWQADAVCAQTDPDAFFPDSEQPSHQVRDAKAVCAGCPVRLECLEAGMGEPFGIWGGLTSPERRRLRRSTGVVTSGTCGTRAQRAEILARATALATATVAEVA